MPFTDLWLVYRVRTGHRAEFDTLYSRHASRVYNFLRRLCADATLAEDLTQDTFLAAYQSLTTWNRRGAFSTWLCGIAVNCYRLRCRQPLREEHDDALDENSPAPPQTDPLTQYTEQESLRLLEKAIHQLPDACREAFVLVYVEEFPYKEAAALLDIPVGTLQSRLNRAKNLLHKRLSGEEIINTSPVAPLNLTPKGDNLHVL